MKKHQHIYKIVAKLDQLELVDGHHTNVIMLKCECQAWDAFPYSNFLLAATYGTDETKLKLQGFQIVKDNEV